MAFRGFRTSGIAFDIDNMGAQLETDTSVATSIHSEETIDLEAADRITIKSASENVYIAASEIASIIVKHDGTIELQNNLGEIVCLAHATLDLESGGNIVINATDEVDINAPLVKINGNDLSYLNKFEFTNTGWIQFYDAAGKVNGVIGPDAENDGLVLAMNTDPDGNPLTVSDLLMLGTNSPYRVWLGGIDSSQINIAGKPYCLIQGPPSKPAKDPFLRLAPGVGNTGPCILIENGDVLPETPNTVALGGDGKGFKSLALCDDTGVGYDLTISEAGALVIKKQYVPTAALRAATDNCYGYHAPMTVPIPSSPYAVQVGDRLVMPVAAYFIGSGLTGLDDWELVTDSPTFPCFTKLATADDIAAGHFNISSGNEGGQRIAAICIAFVGDVAVETDSGSSAVTSPGVLGSSYSPPAIPVGIGLMNHDGSSGTVGSPVFGDISDESWANLSYAGDSHVLSLSAWLGTALPASVDTGTFGLTYEYTDNVATLLIMVSPLPLPE
jgi:hypothetical protein